MFAGQSTLQNQRNTQNGSQQDYPDSIDKTGPAQVDGATPTKETTAATQTAEEPAKGEKTGLLEKVFNKVKDAVTGNKT